MDRITTSLLDEFCADAALTDLPEEKRFEHFASYLAVSRHLSESFDTREAVTGSGGDTGIDAIAIIVNGALVTDPELVEELSATNGHLDLSGEAQTSQKRSCDRCRRGDGRRLRAQQQVQAGESRLPSVLRDYRPMDR